MDLHKLLKEYLASNNVLQLATVANGNPWICTVNFVNDTANNLYWISTKARRHSQEILDNPSVAVAIVHDANQKQALQITGKASIVSLDDSERVNKLYSEKFGDKPERLAEVLANTETGRAYWVLRPDTIAFWDEVNFPDSPKQLVRLD